MDGGSSKDKRRLWGGRRALQRGWDAGALGVSTPGWQGRAQQGTRKRWIAFLEVGVANCEGSARLRGLTPAPRQPPYLRRVRVHWAAPRLQPFWRLLGPSLVAVVGVARACRGGRQRRGRWGGC